MELVAIENTRIVYLTQLHRPSGQPYLPEAMYKLAQRYSFVQTPTLEDLSKEISTFGTGKFQDVQIQEMKIYSDGVVVSSRSDSGIIDAFLIDLFSWCESELGLVPLITAKPEKYYDSYLIVRSSADLVEAIQPSVNALTAFNQLWKGDYLSGQEYKFSGFQMDCDTTDLKMRRKPVRFNIERRAGSAYADNVFFCEAPLKTVDHLALLERIEGLAG